MAEVSAAFPRVTIQFCTQCKWMLRAAYVSVHFHLSIRPVRIRGAISVLEA
jgi:predicted Rdx family selenoprotein